MRTWIVAAMLVTASCLLGQEAGKKHESHRVFHTSARLRIVKRVDPVYPEEAKKKGVAGTVVVEVTIDKLGAAKGVRVTKGDPALAKAVLEAIRQWRWEPHKLNGEAVEVETTVVVRFEPLGK